MKELFFKHADYFYTVTINETEVRKVRTRDGKLDYKKYISKIKEELGPATKVWIKLDTYLHWTECTQGNIGRY